MLRSVSFAGALFSAAKTSSRKSLKSLSLQGSGAAAVSVPHSVFFRQSKQNEFQFQHFSTTSYDRYDDDLEEEINSLLKSNKTAPFSFKKESTPISENETRATEPTNPNFKIGDWNCPNCNEHCFASKQNCYVCNTLKPTDTPPRVFVETQVSATGSSNPNFKLGDWNCPNCNEHCFASKQKCYVCRTARPSGTPSAPGPPRPIVPETQVRAPRFNSLNTFKRGDWNCPNCNEHCFASDHTCTSCNTTKPDFGMEARASDVQRPFKSGDWNCPNCNEHCFATKQNCYICNTSKPTDTPPRAGVTTESTNSNFRDGDWNCPNCNNHCYASKNNCFICRTARPVPRVFGENGTRATESTNPNFKSGDWTCPNCNEHCFASKQNCFICNAAKPTDTPPRAVEFRATQSPNLNFRAGDWNCPTCNNHCFASKQNCFICNAAKPTDTPPRSIGETQVRATEVSATESSNPSFKAGDWNCPNCNEHCFASKQNCYVCNTAKPVMNIPQEA